MTTYDFSSLNISEYTFTGYSQQSYTGTLSSYTYGGYIYDEDHEQDQDETGYFSNKDENKGYVFSTVEPWSDYDNDGDYGYFQADKYYIVVPYPPGAGSNYYYPIIHELTDSELKELSYQNMYDFSVLNGKTYNFISDSDNGTIAMTISNLNTHVYIDGDSIPSTLTGYFIYYRQEGVNGFGSNQAYADIKQESFGVFYRSSSSETARSYQLTMYTLTYESRYSQDSETINCLSDISVLVKDGVYTRNSDVSTITKNPILKITYKDNDDTECGTESPQGTVKFTTTTTYIQDGGTKTPDKFYEDEMTTTEYTHYNPNQEITLTSDLTLYPYGISSSNTTSQITAKASVQLNSSYAKTGYKLVGWTTIKDSATATYKPGDTYEESITENKEITLYAVGKELIYVDRPIKTISVKNYSETDADAYTMYVNEGSIHVGKTLIADATNLNDYVKSSDLETNLNDYVKSSDLETNLSDYVKSSVLDEKIAKYVESSVLDEKIAKCIDSDALTETLKSYAVASSLDDYAKTTALSAATTDIANLGEVVMNLMSRVDELENSK